MKGMFSIVMPITRFSYLLDANAKPSAEHDNIQRFFRVGWKTLEKYIEWEDVHTFFIIIPAVHKPYFDKHAPVNLVSKMKCILEEDIVKYRTGKYNIQMISKLLIAKNHMKTDYYLVIDDDIVLLRKFGMNDLFSNRVTGQIRYTHDTTFNENWWNSSAEILKMKTYDRKNIMSVTPQILITKEVKNLLNHLGTLYDDWEYTLMNTKYRWTEYTLYWLYLMKYNKRRLYRRSKIPLSDNITNIWFYSGNLEKSVETLFKNKKQYFGVIQSNVREHTYVVVENAIRAYM